MGVTPLTADFLMCTSQAPKREGAELLSKLTVQLLVVSLVWVV